MKEQIQKLYLLQSLKNVYYSPPNLLELVHNLHEAFLKYNLILIIK